MQAPFVLAKDDTPVSVPEVEGQSPGAWTILGIDTVTGKVDLVRHLPELADNVPAFKAAIVASLEEHVSQYSETLFGMVQQTEANKKINKRPLILNMESAMQLIGRASGRLEGAYNRLFSWSGDGRFETLVPYSVTAKYTESEELELAKCVPYVNGTYYVAFGARGWAAAAAD